MKLFFLSQKPHITKVNYMTVNLITRRVRTNGAQVMAKRQRADASMFLTSKKYKVTWMWLISI